MRFASVTITSANRLKRLAWMITCAILFAPTPRTWFTWRRWVLRLFGAKLASRAFVYPSVRIWAPWQLEMEDYAVLDHRVDCYNMAPVTLRARAIVSRDAALCTASHDHNSPSFQLVAAPIQIGADAWVALGAYIGPGVIVGEGSVIGARSVVTREVASRAVVIGSPARSVGTRNPIARNHD
jgi:putative colanic acid biosynthesis acetyltransferase WcaF